MEHEKYVRALMRKYYQPSGKLNTEEDALSIIQKAVAFAMVNFDASKNTKVTTYIHTVVRNTIRTLHRDEFNHDSFSELPADFDKETRGEQEDFEFVDDMAKILSPQEMSIFWLVQADMTKEEMYELGHTRHEVEKCFEGIKQKYLSLGVNPKISTLKKKRSKQKSFSPQLPSRQLSSTYLAANQ